MAAPKGPVFLSAVSEKAQAVMQGRTRTLFSLNVFSCGQPARRGGRKNVAQGGSPGGSPGKPAPDRSLSLAARRAKFFVVDPYPGLAP